MEVLLSSRCRNHPEREASARCPGCGSAYCRECVVEHDGRVLCSSCLRKAAPAGAPSARGRWASLCGEFFLAGAGLFLLWGMFYCVGRLLLAVPPPFHAGSFWLKR